MKFNDVGYPVLGDDLHQKIFGALNRPVARPNNLERTRGLLRRFGINVPVDFPEGMYDGDLPFPELPGDTIEERLENMAGEFIDDYLSYADQFAETKLPAFPGYDDIVFVPGWTRYTFDGMVWSFVSAN